MERSLTAGERAALSPGLAEALDAAGAAPVLRDAAHPGARIAALWRGSVPILTRGDVIWWPGAPDDLSAPGLERAMAVLQHELQHVLDYRQGLLTGLGYLANPRNWIYGFDLGEGRAWAAWGAEQRASMAERLWLAERGLAHVAERAALASVIPWTRDDGARDAGARGT
ncbi:MAG TPA: hypothetical protein VG939_20900 [Caulobacteraceae bacterium]|nr:hypothetical protein [Caulobacteraceae bacterium]